MKEAISQEAVSDISHSRILERNEGNATSSLKSAAMLGLALSVGASGALVSQTEASAAVSVPTNAATTEAFSSGSRVLAPQAAALDDSNISADKATTPVVGYHTVESGQSLWQIAQQHRVGLRELKSANALPPETSIRVGQVLRVPGSTSEMQQSLVSEAPAQLVANAAPTESVSDAAAQREGELTSTDVSTQVENSEADLRQELAASHLESTAPTRSIQIEIAEPLEIADASALRLELASEEVIEAPASEQAVTVPAPTVTALALPAAATSTYQVRSGDTLSNIASAVGTTSEELIRINRLDNPNVIFAGATLTVPSTESAAPSPAPQNVTKKVEAPAADAAEQRPASEHLAYLQSTAQRPSAARILETQRDASLATGGSVDDEQIVETSVLSTTAESSESIDPYVADLLEEVQEVRTQPVQVSEATNSEAIGGEIGGNSEAESGSRLIARNATANRPTSQLNVTGRSERVALSTGPAAEADSELLAAAPISPDAYIPAQRSSTGQIVSPDMPILPAADEYLPEAPAYFNGYIWPTQGTLTSGYGWRWGRMHRGVDVAGPVGTPVVAAASGVVEQAGWNSGGYGNLVEIRHPDGSLTRYAHNNRLSVRAGQVVRQGQQISEMGSTGYSTGPHLHFEVHPQGGGAVNPMAYLPRR
ncbi:MAG: peptidoglycan DD-metalloendopeptidase family protein [Phormidesmis sp.]